MAGLTKKARFVGRVVQFSAYRVDNLALLYHMAGSRRGADEKM